VLTVAHLDHQPENNDPANLLAMCQRCHSRYDAELHARNARRTRRARKAAGDLFPDDNGGSHG
jgi:cytochrome c553